MHPVDIKSKKCQNCSSVVLNTVISLTRKVKKKNAETSRNSMLMFYSNNFKIMQYSQIVCMKLNSQKHINENMKNL